MRDQIKQAVQILKSGGVVAFPTETVYGLGARVFDEKAVRKIFRIKGRPADNPLIVHICEQRQLKSLAARIPRDANQLIKKFWPGPLTLVFKKSARVPAAVTAGLDTVAVRMPSHPVARRLLRTLKEPIAAPSANLSGRPSPTRHCDVVKELGDKADFIVEGEESEHGLESTVVDATQEPFRILRPGSITIEKLKKIVPTISFYSKRAAHVAPPSPGMKHRHYAPHFKVVVLKPAQWTRTIRKYRNLKKRIGALSLTQPAPRQKNIVFKRAFLRGKSEFAKKLYATFFEAERAKIEILFVESIEPKGIGHAIMDRLHRASAGK